MLHYNIYTVRDTTGFNENIGFVDIDALLPEVRIHN